MKCSLVLVMESGGEWASAPFACDGHEREFAGEHDERHEVVDGGTHGRQLPEGGHCVALGAQLEQFERRACGRQQVGYTEVQEEPARAIATICNLNV